MKTTCLLYLSISPWRPRSSCVPPRGAHCLARCAGVGSPPWNRSQARLAEWHRKQSTFLLYSLPLLGLSHDSLLQRSLEDSLGDVAMPGENRRQSQRERQANRPTDGQTEGGTNGRTERGSYKRTDRRTERGSYKRTDRKRELQTDGQKEGATNGRTDGQKEGATNGRTDGQKEGATNGRTDRGR